jgi:hypothetical protein
VVSDFISMISDPAPAPPVHGMSVVQADTPAWVEEYNRTHSWDQLLASSGWTLQRTDAEGVSYWIRPGKSAREGISATTNHKGLDLLYVFTTSVPWLVADRAYDKWGFHVRRDHGGDFKAASRDYRPKDDLRTLVQHPEPKQASAEPFAEPDLVDGSLLASLEIDFSADGSFWNTEVTSDDWLIPDLVARGRGHVMYAGAKTGKSLVALAAIAASCVPGHRAWTQAADPITVVYLDYEMTEADLRQRLVEFGYGPDDDFSHLHYVRAMAFGSDLDTREGGEALLAYAISVKADLVVIDTMSRAVRGEENDSDTVRNFYRCTGGLLKGYGIATLRLDHAGKQKDRGQRGSSGKNDDVDIVWRLDKRDGGVELVKEHARMSWVTDKVDISYEETDDGMTVLKRSEGMWPSGVAEKAREMDAAGLPVDVSKEAARAAGVRGKNSLLIATIRFRRERAESVPLSVGTRGGLGDSGGDRGWGLRRPPLKGTHEATRRGLGPLKEDR